MLRHKQVHAPAARRPERGAALITATLISLLMLAAGSAFILVAARSVKNAYGSTPETQAYYAAEAGAQAALNALRGHVQPAPLFNPASATAAENKVTFRQLETKSDLAPWLTYNAGYSPKRVTLTSNYTQANGMAFDVSAIDPDNTRTVITRVTGAFPANNGTSIKFGGTGSAASATTVTITYTPPANEPTTITLSGTKSFGTLSFTPDKPQFASNTITNYYAQGLDFNLTVTQTAPYPATTAAPLTVTLKCKITGVISTVAANNTVQLVFPALSNNIGGVSYKRTTSTGTVAQPLAYATATAIAPSVVTAPDPYRLILSVTGYGPSYAEKHLHLMVNRNGFDFTASAAVTMRGSDTGSTMTFAIGDSAKYGYTGNDNAGGVALPGFAVTNGQDFTKATTVINGGTPCTTCPTSTQVTGTSAVKQVSPNDLPSFLQNAQSARDLVSALRESAQAEYWPVGSTGAGNDRYFPSGSAPSDFGANNPTATPNGLFTFVDGDVALPANTGGAGLLVVTGTLDLRGSAEFKGLILVLGKGEVLRNGGGGGTTLGSIVVAKFGDAGEFLAPYFDSNGSGNSDVKYDSKWVENALTRLGPRVLGVSEY
ncbi:MAG TPA: hypothetical protein VF591_04585 [Pyrinomonadaceae bacterium]|jgi:hypothetical protein